MNNSKIIYDKIFNANKIGIYTHANVDGDAIGSAFAFYYLLKDLGKEVNVFSKTTIPNQLKFLQIDDLINRRTTKPYDLVIAVDCATKEMMNIYCPDFSNYKDTIQFDHHPTNSHYAKLEIVEIDRSSACEVIANFLYENNVKINEKVGKFLLTGIITDTGGFKFSCTTKRTMEIVYKLLTDTGIELSALMSNIFESEEPEYLQLYKEAINNTKLLYDNKICVISIPYSFYNKTGVDPNSAKNLTRIGTEIKDVVLTCLVAEVEPNVCKVSFRSRKNYDCSICAGVFGGGGHKQASGCKIFDNYNNVIDRVIKSMVDIL